MLWHSSWEELRITKLSPNCQCGPTWIVEPYCKLGGGLCGARARDGGCRFPIGGLHVGEGTDVIL